MRILGIDPGLADCGWGVVDFISQRYQPVSFGVIKTPAGEDLQKRIILISSKIREIAEKHMVVMASMEEIYFTAHSTSSALNVSKVIGAILCELGKEGIPCRMFSPLQIKMSITGYGRADKNQVQEMSRIILKLPEIPKPDHTADALSAAICMGNNFSTEAKFKL
ncbi:MAG: crossover junction endodeoxyribonuclease RuvC [Sphaerochaetaceae bacterium]|jgi:crossover junction endodeoxyribonuclease RuvC|nr:crossover junction endodeoxyribonuclease RuvC [Sphaerochaetaceae bacterium]NLY08019.1 crossover junction endodeoxyribonuclease RuvC [Spirochaetales bacterium]